MLSGRFISIEGGEGAGKSTQIQVLAEYLRKKGYAVTLTREPGGTDVSEAIRSMLLDHSLPDMHHDTELMLMFAARAEHVQCLIKPALQRGEWVISDRFSDASHVYQGAGRGLDQTRLQALHQWTLGDFEPDLTLLFDIPVEIGMERVRKRGEKDRFEQENMAFFKRIRQGYLERAKLFPDRFEVIDANAIPELVSDAMLQRVQAWMRR